MAWLFSPSQALPWRTNPAEPMTRPVSRSATAKALGEEKTVRMISRLSSTLSWGFQPAMGPTRGSLA